MSLRLTSAVRTYRIRKRRLITGNVSHSLITTSTSCRLGSLQNVRPAQHLEGRREIVNSYGNSSFGWNHCHGQFTDLPLKFTWKGELLPSRNPLKTKLFLILVLDICMHMAMLLAEKTMQDLECLQIHPTTIVQMWATIKTDSELPPHKKVEH